MIVTDPLKVKVMDKRANEFCYEAVKGNMKVFNDAHEYDVPRVTLQDQILGRGG